MKKNFILLLTVGSLISSCNNSDSNTPNLIEQTVKTSGAEEEFTWSFKKTDDENYLATLSVKDGENNLKIAEKTIKVKLNKDVPINNTWSNDTLTFDVPFTFDNIVTTTSKGTTVIIKGRP